MAASGFSGSTTGDGRWESTPLLPTNHVQEALTVWFLGFRVYRGV